MSVMTKPRELDDTFGLVPLTLLRSGQSGRIGEVLGTGRVVDHLRELGLRAGVTVEMVRSGSPCILKLDGQKLCVRSDEMTGVLVRTGAGR